MKNDVGPGNERNRLLEVIVISVEDAIAAEQGGARRLEVISDFAVGGLTPAVELVKAIQQVVSIPLRVMLRANPGFEVANPREYETLRRQAKQFADLGVEGLVLGFLREGAIDLATLQEILSCAPNLKATFHRAFEVLQEPFRAIEVLKQLKQIDRILTSGGLKDGQENVELLNRLQKYADPELTILVGGGLSIHQVEGLCAETAIREFHLGRAVRHPQQITGVVCAQRVNQVLQIIG